MRKILTLAVVALLTSSIPLSADKTVDISTHIKSWERSTFSYIDTHEEKLAEDFAASLTDYIKTNDKNLKKLKAKDDIELELLTPNELPDVELSKTDIDLYIKARESKSNLERAIAREEKRRKEEIERLERERLEAIKKAQEEREEKSRERANVTSIKKSKASASRSNQKKTSSQPKLSERDRIWQLIQNTLNGLPANTKKGIKELKMVDSIQGGRYSGSTYWPEGRIEIATNWNDRIIIDTVIHEVGHIFHFRNGFHYSDEWEQIFQEEWVNLGQYGSTNTREAFAQTFEVIYSPHYDVNDARNYIPKSIDYVIRKVNSGV